MVSSILTENDRYNECFFFRSTVPCEPDLQDKIQILNGNEETVFQANTAIAHCISTDAKMSKGFAEKVCRRLNGYQEYSRKVKIVVASGLPYWDPESINFFYNLVKKSQLLRETNARQPSNLTQKYERTFFT